MVGGEGKTITDVAQGHLNLVSLSLVPTTLIWPCTDGPSSSSSSKSTHIQHPCSPFCSSLRLTVINSHADGLFQAAYKCRKWHVINELFKWDVPLCSPSSLTCWWRCEETVRGDSQAPSHHLPCSTSAPWNESFPLLRRSWTPGSLQRACLFVQQCNQGVCRYKT